MTLSISLEEALALARAKSDKIVSLRVVSHDTLAVGVEMKVKVPLLGEISKQVEIHLQIERIQDEKLFVKCGSEGFAWNLVIKTILAVFSISDTSPVIEVYSDRQLKIRLREIDKLQDVLDKIMINSLSFENNCILADFILKSL